MAKNKGKKKQADKQAEPAAAETQQQPDQPSETPPETPEQPQQRKTDVYRLLRNHRGHQAGETFRGEQLKAAGFREGDAAYFERVS